MHTRSPPYAAHWLSTSLHPSGTALPTGVSAPFLKPSILTASFFVSMPCTASTLALMMAYSASTLSQETKHCSGRVQNFASPSASALVHLSTACCTFSSVLLETSTSACTSAGTMAVVVDVVVALLDDVVVDVVVVVSVHDSSRCGASTSCSWPSGHGPQIASADGVARE